MFWVDILHCYRKFRGTKFLYLIHVVGSTQFVYTTLTNHATALSTIRCSTVSLYLNLLFIVMWKRLFGPFAAKAHYLERTIHHCNGLSLDMNNNPGWAFLLISFISWFQTKYLKNRSDLYSCQQCNYPAFHQTYQPLWLNYYRSLTWVVWASWERRIP